MENPVRREISSGILLYLLRAKTKKGAVKTRAITYPGLGAKRKAMVFAVIKAAEKLMI